MRGITGKWTLRLFTTLSEDASCIVDKMVRTCAYPGCFNICKKATLRKGSRTKEKLTFHRFPTYDGDQLKLWMDALNLNIKTPTRVIKRWRICSDHFFPSDFNSTQRGREFLKTSAVPHMVAVQQRGDNPNDPRSTDDPEILQDTVTWLNRFFFVRCSSVNASETKKDRN